jgi:hypothetical protein
MAVKGAGLLSRGLTTLWSFTMTSGALGTTTELTPLLDPPRVVAVKGSGSLSRGLTTVWSFTMTSVALGTTTELTPLLDPHPIGETGDQVPPTRVTSKGVGDSEGRTFRGRRTMWYAVSSPHSTFMYHLQVRFSKYHFHS